MYASGQPMNNDEQELAHASRLTGKGDAQGAIKVYRGIVRRAKDSPAAHLSLGQALLSTGDGRGAALHQAGRSEDAIHAVQEALMLRPGFAETHIGTIFADEGDAGRAADQFARALAADPALIGAIVNQGHAFLDLGRVDETRARFAEAITLDADSAPAHNGLGLALRAENRQAEARAAFETACTLDRNSAEALNNLAITTQALGRHGDALRLCRDVVSAHPGLAAGHLKLGHILQSLGRHEEAAAAFEAAIGIDPKLDGAFPFLAHSLMYLCQWRDLQEVSGRVLELAEADDHRAPTVPIQAHYLGYGSTVGADFIPWLLTDAVHTPPELAPHCSEALVTLPDSFMAATRAPISSTPVTRADCGLQDDAIVFVNSNAPHKFDPRAFKVWMELLRGSPGSVLWLRDGTPAVMANLRGEASRHSIDAARLIFAPRADHAEHLARHRLADIALDTQYNASGVTTIDALWAGVPAVTIAGGAHSARTGASTLSAMEMPELICADLDPYAALAGNLAKDGAKRTGLHEKIAAKRDAAPLFDVTRLARHLEGAYRLMWENWRDGHAPCNIRVPLMAQS